MDTFIKDGCCRLLEILADSNNVYIDKEVNIILDEIQEPQKSETDNEKLADSEYIQTLIDKIHILKKELIAENDKLGSPIDLSTIFKMEVYDNIHTKCKDEYESLKNEFDAYKLHYNDKDESNEERNEIEVLKSEVALLKDKADTYRMMLEEEKQDKADSLKLSEEVGLVGSTIIQLKNS